MVKPALLSPKKVQKCSSPRKAKEDFNVAGNWLQNNEPTLPAKEIAHLFGMLGIS